MRTFRKLFQRRLFQRLLGGVGLLPAGLLLGFAFAGCGGAPDDLGSLGDPDQQVALGLPVPVNTVVSQITPFIAAASSNQDGFLIPTTTPSAGSPYIGLVTSVDNVSGLISIRIIHNGNLSTRVSNLATASVRAGDTVLQGQPLGSCAGSVLFSVYYNGSAVCPLSFLDPTTRQQIDSRFNGQAPCQ